MIANAWREKATGGKKLNLILVGGVIKLIKCAFDVAAGRQLIIIFTIDLIVKSIKSPQISQKWHHNLSELKMTRSYFFYTSTNGKKHKYINFYSDFKRRRLVSCCICEAETREELAFLPQNCWLTNLIIN